MSESCGDCGTPGDKFCRCMRTAEQAILDVWAMQTGIPAATLQGLREGKLVAVPAEPTEAMVLQGWLTLPRLRPDTSAVARVYRAMLTAAKAPTP